WCSSSSTSGGCEVRARITVWPTAASPWLGWRRGRPGCSLEEGTEEPTEVDSDVTTDPAQPLAGRVALVAGGSRGLGLAIATASAAAAAAAVTASPKLDACEPAAAAITEKTGRRALPVACHVGHWDDLDRLAEESYAAFGHVDVLVNNAGMSPLYSTL